MSLCPVHTLGRELIDQKFLQYETVLGPEDGEASPAPVGILAGDEEKNINGAEHVKDTTVAISGPGLGDLHTVGENSDVCSPFTLYVVVADINSDSNWLLQTQVWIIDSTRLRVCCIDSPKIKPHNHELPI